MIAKEKIEQSDTIEESKREFSPPRTTQSNRKQHYFNKRLIESRSNPVAASFLWKQSSSTLTRDRSPSHRIPKAARFASTERQKVFCDNFLTINLRKQLGEDYKKCIAFPKSSRPQHFQKAYNEGTPSPLTYNKIRFMDDSAYKSPKNKAQLQRLYILDTKKDQFQIQDKFRVRGISISTFTSHHKTYTPHSKHRVYQPECTINNPGVGEYNLSTINKTQQAKYSFRLILKRFNEKKNQNPSPDNYNPQLKFQTLSPAKGTFHKSQRTYLRKIQKIPGPSDYHINRFLE